MKRNVKITSYGYYLPKRKVSSEELDQKMGLPKGTVGGKSKIYNHYYADNETETQSKMGAYALMDALERSQMKFEELDAIICTSGTGEQEIPSTAALILKALKKDSCGIMAFDINSTCLSFVTGFDTISYMVAAGRFKKVALVSTEIASVGLNYKHLESASLFSDGAAAMILEPTPEGEESEVLSGKMELYPEGADSCRIVGGGSALHPRNFDPKENMEKFCFEMDGKAVFKLASKVAKGFIERFLTESKMTLKNVDVVVPHQASTSGMSLVQKKLELPDEKWVNIIEDHGNMISASIPLAFAKAVESGQIKRGDNVMLFGTSAGFGIGGVIFKY